MRLFKQLLTNNECYKSARTITPKGVMWHSTGANNPNLCRYVQPDDGQLGINKYNNDWNQFRPGNRQVCVHAFIGKDKNGNIATYQTLPFNMRGWHAGGDANSSYIGFEICEDDLTNAEYFKKVYEEACEFTAYLCKMYNLDPMKDGVVICHSEGHTRGIASNHSDVLHWFSRFGKTMNDVRKDVKNLMGYGVVYTVKFENFLSKENADKLVAAIDALGYKASVVTAGNTAPVTSAPATSEPATSAPAPTTIKVGDMVRVKKDAKSYTGGSIASFVYNNEYVVDQINGDRVVLDKNGICTPFKMTDLYKASVVTAGNTAPAPSAPAPAPTTIKVGDMVRVKKDAKSYTGGSIASFVYNNEYVVDQINGDRVVLDKNGICTPFKMTDLYKASVVTAGNTAPAPSAPAPAPTTIKVGDMVRVKKDAKSYTGGSIASFVYNNEYVVDQINGDRVVLDKKGICTPFKMADLYKA